MTQPYMIGSVLFGADEMVTAFVRSRVPQAQESGFGPSTALGVVKDGRFLGGVVYHDYRQHDIMASYAFDSPRWASPAVLRTLFAYPFQQLGVVRMTAIIGRKNKHARKLAERMGFKLEGIARKALDGRQDAILYGLLASECKWIKPREREGKSDGQEVSTKAARSA